LLKDTLLFFGEVDGHDGNIMRQKERSKLV
jgi:hypothetical protein